MPNIEGFWELVLGSNPVLPANQSSLVRSLLTQGEKGPLLGGLSELELSQRAWPKAESKAFARSLLCCRFPGSTLPVDPSQRSPCSEPPPLLLGGRAEHARN